MLNKKKLKPNWVPSDKYKYDGVVFHTTAYQKNKRLYMAMANDSGGYNIGDYPYNDNHNSVVDYKSKALKKYFEKRKVWTVVKKVSSITDPDYLKYKKVLT